jgi:putative addiction module component (TIGR02574 family)
VELIVAAVLKDIENQASQLSSQERGALIRRLIVSLEGVPEDSPESIAKAWDEEMARRVADLEAGRTQWIPAAEVMSRIRALIYATKTTHAD